MAGSAQAFTWGDGDGGSTPKKDWGKKRAADALKADDYASVDLSKDSVITPITPKEKVVTKKAEAAPQKGKRFAESIRLEDLDDSGDLPAPPVARVTAPPPAEKTAAAPIRSKESSFFSTSFATPVELASTLSDKYGTEWLEWEPETLWKEIREDWNTQISRINHEKINAAKLLLLSDSFWRNWETFEKVVLAFNSVMPLFDRKQDITVGQMVHAVAQANEMRQEAFSDEVLSYIAMQAKEEGFLWLPAPLGVAQERLNELNPEGSEGNANLADEVRARWQAIEETDLDTIEFAEDIFGIHLAKLAAIDGYLETMSSPEMEEDI